MEVWISWENEVPVKTGETLEIGIFEKIGFYVIPISVALRTLNPVRPV